MSCQVKFPLQDIVLLLREKINPEVIGAVSEEKLEEEVLAFIQPKIDELQGQLSNLPDEVHIVSQNLDGSILETTLSNGEVYQTDLEPLLTRFDGLFSLYEKNVAAGAGANGWTSSLVLDVNQNKLQSEINDSLTRGKIFIDWFGAKTNEQSANFDSTAKFQIALDTAAVQKKDLILTGGTYNITLVGNKSSLNGALNLTSAHNGINIIGLGNVTIRAIGTNDDFFSMLKIVDAKKIQFQNITFDGNGSKYWQSDNVNSYENGYAAINIRSNSDNAIDDILFYNCRFKNTGESAVTSWGSGGIPLPHYFSNRVKFLFCEFENIGAHGIGMNEFRNSSVSMCNFINIGMKKLVGNFGSGYAVDVSGGCEDVIVSGCNVDGSGGGFKAETHTYGATDQSAKRITFLNNHIKNLWQNGRYSGEDFGANYPAYRLNGVGCQIIGGTISAYAYGIVFSGKAKDCIVTDVVISSNVAANYDGIYFENASDTYGNNSASFNNISNITRYGINMQAARSTASNNKVSLCGGGGIFINYARNANVKNNECFDNTSFGIKVSKTTINASIVDNECYDSRTTGKTQTTGIAVTSTYDEAMGIQVQGNNSHDNGSYDYSMSTTNTYSINHLGYKEVYGGVVPTGGLWKNGDKVVQSYVAPNRPNGWICTNTGGAVEGVIPLNTAINGGKWYQWDSGTTVWEVRIAGTTAAISPDITGKAIGDTVTHGTATLVLRATTVANFVGDGLNATVAYDPPSLATATQQSTTVTLAGAKVGNNVSVAFDRMLNGTRMWGEITANDTVTVYHRNDTGATVDVASGYVTVKIV